MNKVLLYCRAGFEKECAAEITAKAAEVEIYGFPRIKDNSGYVLFECYQYADADRLLQTIPFTQLIFARQLLVVGELLTNLPPDDRITPVTGMLQGVVEQGSDLRVEVPDTNETKELLKFCRKFTVPLRGSLRAQGILAKHRVTSKPVIHVFFIAPGTCYTGYSYPSNNSPFFMGIPRLRFPADAPSRSTLKLEEAFHVFIPADEWEERLMSGMYAVDLGACPGGWTYQLVRRSMMVYAVDNGPMAPALMESGQVTHCREDGFKYQPNRNNIHWLVCDMVEKPKKVASLMAHWLIQGWCREAIFNLKLPMKKRYDEVMENLSMLESLLEEQGVNAQIQAKHLYHDREEITVHVRRIWAAVGGRWDERQTKHPKSLTSKIA